MVPYRNNVPIIDTDYALTETKTVVFAGGTTNDTGDYNGTGNPTTLFTVTGTCAVRVLTKCTETLLGNSATLEIGTALTTAGLIAQTTATGIAINEIWHDNSPDASVELTSVMAENIVSQDIIQTVGTANITDGTIVYTCFWYPLSADGKVEAA